MKNDMAPIVLFDFDGTLTRKDTMMPFLKYVAGNKLYYAKLLLLSPIITGYLLHLLKNDIAKTIVLRAFLNGYTSEALNRHGEAFAREKIPALLRPEGIKQLEKHQKLGHRCILVSASLDIYLKHWAEGQGFERVISSSLKEFNSGKVSGELKGANCHGIEKVNYVKRAIPDLNQSVTFGYGDSKSDLFLLKLCDKGFILRKGAFMDIDNSGKVDHD